ncbi:MAG: hypothetical protein R2801_06435 [Chitinophagales bacterium]
MTNKDHRSCLMNINTPDICTKTVSINWTPYLYENGSPTNYEIQTKSGSGSYAIVGSVDNTATIISYKIFQLRPLYVLE